MRVQIQLRIVTDDDNVLSEDVIACFDKGDDQLEEIGLSLDQAGSVSFRGELRSGQTPDYQKLYHAAEIRSRSAATR